MSQNSLFDAAVYVQRAYDQLTLAYDEWDLEEIQMLKQAVMRGYISVCRLREQQLDLYESEQTEVPF